MNAGTRAINAMMWRHVSYILGLVVIVLLLTGCAHTRYVAVPCLSGEQYEKLKQAEPPKVHDRLTGKADEDVKPIAGSNIRLRAWGQGMLTVLGGCVG